ncbi:MAG: endonuclease/exonuclease/phosphatase family protein [Solirubrobacteraceae bacterium]|nr:endonuclease/exonuclease/phosphatase family protein [Solirubrobacteraceae bacterium]
MTRTLLAAAVAAPWVLWALLRLTGLALPYPVAPALAFTPYVAATAILPVVVALALRQRVIALVAGVAAAGLVLMVLPRGIGDAEPMNAGPRLTVMSMNTLRGRADQATVMRLARAHDVDVLSLQESRPAWVAGLDALGARRQFPSRAPRLYDEGLLGPAGMRATGGAEGEITLAPGVTVRITAIHPRPPVSREAWRAWRDELLVLPEADTAAPARRVLVGDFNATLDHPELREVIGRGYRDAADVVGAGWQTTWPAGRRLPPEITIDHVLAQEGVRILSFSVHPVPGSDHRAIIAELGFPGPNSA